MTSDSPLLQARGLTKNFPGVRALGAVDFTLRRGEIHALMGENGAGKSTLIKTVTGVYPPDAGEMLLEGRRIRPRSPHDAQRLGISTVYQEVNLVPTLSVAENISLGREPTRLGKVRWRAVRDRARAALARLDVALDVWRPLGGYPIAMQQLVAVARAVDIEARVLILDEPTSSLSAAEVARLFAVMRRLRDGGMGIIFVTHFLEQVYAVSDRITILRNGRRVAEHEASRLSRLQLVSEMIGRDLADAEKLTDRHGAAPTAGEHQPLLETMQLGRSGSVQGIDLRVGAGQVVGIAGLLGSGRTETARLLFGLDHPDRGALRLRGVPARIRSPRRAMKLGIGLAPEDRKAQAILPDLSVRENIVISLQSRRGWWRRLSRRKQAELVDRLMRALDIRAPAPRFPIRNLSGGNQQKVILARWLASEPQLLILDEPTRGIDVGAKAEIEKLVARLCRDGMGILFISSEIDEMARNCHEIIVLRDRRQVGRLRGAEISPQAIMQTIAASPATTLTPTPTEAAAP